MPVRIRLKRVGAKGQPHYRIVVADGRASRDGRIIEAIGHYNPLPSEPEIGVDEERAMLWLERGALPSETVAGLLTKRGIMERYYQKWPKRRPAQGAQAAAAPQQSAAEAAVPQGGAEPESAAAQGPAPEAAPEAPESPEAGAVEGAQEA
jgi:small subunit ribosomal protein S16